MSGAASSDRIDKIKTWIQRNRVYRFSYRDLTRYPCRRLQSDEIFQMINEGERRLFWRRHDVLTAKNGKQTVVWAVNPALHGGEQINDQPAWSEE